MKPRNNTSLVLSLTALVAGMVLLAYASVPLYRMFCEATGFGGATKRVDAASTRVIDRAVTVRFNADIAAGLPWEFAPEEKQIKLKVGENRLTAYRVKNNSDQSITGHATYNVVPEIAGAYFAKIECFCFQDQTLKAGEAVDMPISFYIDPAISDDPNLRDVKTITLSYTFFPTKYKAVTPTKP
jgi:cytochrome c oxidase assembly protein subunit 11